jgi:epoxyqueuosine reductase
LEGEDLQDEGGVESAATVDPGVGSVSGDVVAFGADLRARAMGMGFQQVGICAPEPSETMEFYRWWTGEGLHGEMAYLARPDAVARREDLRGTMDSVRSVVVVTQNYFQTDSPGVPEDPSRGVVARYARGEDYHQVLKARLIELLRWLRREARDRGMAGDVRGFAYVDTGPILERELARRAGLGWFGRNTMLIHPSHGSYSFLGMLLLDLPLRPDPAHTPDRCGTCSACLEACPTGALLGRDENGGPIMDARRCISYLTIELKGPIPRELRPLVGNRIFGCDICQEVCPWNVKFAEPGEEPSYQAGPDTDGPALMELMGMTQEEFNQRFSGSPIKRAKRRGFLRNVAVALGNWRSPEAVPVLAPTLEDEEPLVRGHAAWALGRILGRTGIPGDRGFVAAEALLGRLEVEEDEWVREEIGAALRG